MKYYDIWPSLSVIIFIIVAFYYWNSRYKYFFLINSLSDLISTLLWGFFSLSSQSLWIPFNYLWLFSVDKDVFIKQRYIIMLGLIPILIINYFSTTFSQYIFGLIITILLLFVFIRFFIKEYFNNSTINSFYLAMMLFEANLTVRLIAIIKDVSLGVNVFYASMSIQAAVGVFLIIIRKRHLLKQPE